MDLGLKGKTALVTGSHRGTGAGIAAVLAAEGARVVVHGFESGQPEEVVAQITEAGGLARGAVADITSDEGADALGAIVDDVDIVVANYGAPMGSAWDSTDTWSEEWDRNVVAGVRVVQRCLPGMRERGWGRAIFVGTVGTRMPSVHTPGYYAAKAGLPALVRSLAQELRGTGVTANVVSPGMIATAEVKAMLTKRAEREGIGPDWSAVEGWAVVNRMPNLTAKIPEPTDIGRVVAFVASEAAWHIMGADIAVDGGTVDA
jgi:3-oxoacyl-[acyl-carrier protein] reductase